MSVVERHTNGYEYNYKRTIYELPSNTVLLEVKRLILINNIKRQLKQIAWNTRIHLDIENVFPRWIMTNIGYQEYLVDPLIPYNATEYTQLKKDIKVLSKKRMTDQDVTDILKQFNLTQRCNQAIIELRQFIQSDFYIKNYNNMSVKLEKNDNIYSMSLEYTDNLSQYAALSKSSSLVFNITETVFNKFLNKYTLGTKPDEQFRQLIFIISLRYYILNSLNQQLAVADSFYSALKDEYGCDFELFASSINSFYDNYCSLFSDLEQYFHSRSSFVHFTPVKGFYTSNPPYDEAIMATASKKIVKWLSSSEPLSFLIVIPAWDKDEHKYGKFEAMAILKEAIVVDRIIE